MTTTHRHNRATGNQGTAGLLLSLSHSLPNPTGPLARSARALAHRLAQGTSNFADLDTAAVLLARLLDATDTGVSYDEDGLLDESFDA